MDERHKVSGASWRYCWSCGLRSCFDLFTIVIFLKPLPGAQANLCFLFQGTGRQCQIVCGCLCQLFLLAISADVLMLCRKRPKISVCVCVCARWSSLSPDSACKHVETSTAHWCVVDVSVAWTHWRKTRNLFLLPSVIIFWWLVCFSRARYQPNILSQSPVCTHCSINPMNRPFDWWGMAQECWEIGRARGE